MKFALITALLPLLLALSKPISAAEWPSIELQASCPKLIRGVLKDGTIAYYGCGNKEQVENSERASYEEYAKGHDNTAYEKTSKHRADLYSNLTTELLDPLNKMFDDGGRPIDKTIVFPKTDKLFFEVLASMEETDWSDQPESSLWRNLLFDLTKVGLLTGKHYGAPLITTLERLLTKFPGEEFFAESLRRAIIGTILADESPLNMVPSAEERRTLTQKLVNLYTAYRWRGVYLGPARSIIALTAPDLLKKIEKFAEQ